MTGILPGTVLGTPGIYHLGSSIAAIAWALRVRQGRWILEEYVSCAQGGAVKCFKLCKKLDELLNQGKHVKL